MNKKTKQSQELEEIPSPKSGKLEKYLFYIRATILGVIAWNILYYTSKRMSYETWKLFFALLLLVSGIWVLVDFWLRRNLKESECR